MLRCTQAGVDSHSDRSAPRFQIRSRWGPFGLLFSSPGDSSCAGAEDQGGASGGLGGNELIGSKDPIASITYSGVP